MIKKCEVTIINDKNFVVKTPDGRSIQFPISELKNEKWVYVDLKDDLAYSKVVEKPRPRTRKVKTHEEN